MKTFLRIILLLHSFSSFCQKNFDLINSYKAKRGISGIAYRNDTLFMVPERKNCLYLYNLKNSSRLDSISINLPTETEGLTIYKDEFYIVSERNAVVSKLRIDWKQKKGWAIPLDVYDRKGRKFVFPNFNKKTGRLVGNFGLEGIANDVDSLFYLLQERYMGSKQNIYFAVLFTFGIIISNKEDKIILIYKHEKWLSLKDYQRISDLCYNKSDHSLLAIKSSKDETKYCLVKIKLDKSGNPESEEDLYPDSLTKILKDNNPEGFNIEGITIGNDGTLYIVSDNSEGGKTILLKSK